MKISDYLDESLITFLNAKSRDEAIYHMIDLLDKNGKLSNKELFSKAIFDREKLVSTGIGMGIAIPHAKLQEIEEFFIAIAIQKQKGVDWNSLDRAPVRIIFMIGGPQNRQTEYLKILSMLTAAIRDEEVRKKLLKANASSQVFEIFSDI